MKISLWIIVLGLLLFGSFVPWADALIVESPVEGQTIVVGEPFQWVLRPAPGEVCKRVGGNFLLNPATGKYEKTDVIEPAHALGKQNFLVSGEPIDDSRCLGGKVTLNIVLPPTTTVTGIGAGFNGDKKTFLQIARKPSGELVASGIYSDDELSIGATYSDGVARFVTDNPDFTYKSLDEKVAVVFPPGQWKDSDGKVKTNYALVKATGPGTTDIIVQYGAFTDRVTVKVKECPYIEGVTDKRGCPIGQ